MLFFQYPDPHPKSLPLERQPLNGFNIPGPLVTKVPLKRLNVHPRPG